MAEIPRIQTPTPSTPPFLNLSSPDLKNFKTFFKSSPIIKDDFQFTEMDFEAAYAILTKSPNSGIISNNGVGLGISTINSPGRIIHPQDFRNDDLEFKDVLFKSNTPPPKIMSPDSNIIDLESLAYFPKYDELLSQNESNALEQFLDSIMDDKTRQPNVLDYAAAVSESTEISSSLKLTQQNDSLEFHENLRSNAPIETNTTIPEQPNSSLTIKPKPAVIKISTGESFPKRKKRKKLLTEEEKKLNHTTSEQKRRGLIKEAFDELMSLLPFENELSKRKNPPKSIVLEKAALEIEKLQNINDQLKRLIGQ